MIIIDQIEEGFVLENQEEGIKIVIPNSVVVNMYHELVESLKLPPTLRFTHNPDPVIGDKCKACNGFHGGLSCPMVRLT